MKAKLLFLIAAIPLMSGGEALLQKPQQAPFESEIKAFEAQDRTAPPAKGGIVFVGSSSIRLWKTLKEDFPRYNVIDRGFGGSQISDSVRYAYRIVTPYKPRMIVFFAGSNDIWAGKSPEVVLSDYGHFVNRVRAKLPNVPIVFISITPAPSRWAKLPEVKKANRLIKAYTARKRRLLFVDVFSKMLSETGGPRPDLFVGDQLHMKPAGYAIWTKAITPLLGKPDRS